METQAYFDLNGIEKRELLGSGSFGTVFKAINKKTGEIYAVKVLNDKIEKLNTDIRLNLSREVNIISGIDHPAILDFIGYNPRNFENELYPVIITKFCQNNSLFTILGNAQCGLAPHDWNDTNQNQLL